MKRTLIALIAALALIAAPVLADEDKSADDGADTLSLMTDTPAEGFDLAVSLARRAVVTTQPDKEVLFDQRPQYSQAADSLIAVSQTVAMYFQTVAAANNYWRE